MISMGLGFLLGTTLVCEADRHKNKFVPGSDSQDIKLCSLALWTGNSAPWDTRQGLMCSRHSRTLWSARLALQTGCEHHPALSTILKILLKKRPALEEEREDLVTLWRVAGWAVPGTEQCQVLLQQQCSLLSPQGADISCRKGTRLTSLGEARTELHWPWKEFLTLLPDSSFTLEAALKIYNLTFLLTEAYVKG